jgi:hypothetical protein
MPNCRRSLVLDPQLAEGELAFVDTTQQFNVGEGDGSDAKFLKPSIGRIRLLMPR